MHIECSVLLYKGIGGKNAGYYWTLEYVKVVYYLDCCNWILCSTERIFYGHSDQSFLNKYLLGIDLSVSHAS